MGCATSNNNFFLDTFPICDSTENQIKFLLRLFSLHDPEKFCFLKKTTAGASNFISIFTSPSLKAVVHIYGAEGNFNHDGEKENIKTIGLTKILAEFSNGYVLNYFEGDVLTLDKMKEERISNWIAKKIAKFHSSSPVKNQNDIFKFLDVFRIPLNSEAVNKITEKLQKTLEEGLESTNFVLNHCDLHASNIILQTNDVQFIDYEATTYTWDLYDVADHFMMQTGFQVDMRKYPSIEKQTHFLTVYLTAREGNVPTKVELDEAIRKVQLLVKLSQLVVACWGFLQAKNPPREFPYQQYAEARLKCLDYDLPLSEGHELAREPLVPNMSL